LLRDSVATESIYGFAPEQANAQPEEPIFVLTKTQLKQIISEATQPLQDRIEALESIVAHQEFIKAKFEALEREQNTLSENQYIQLKLINDLRETKNEPNDSPLLDELYKEMVAIGRKQTDFTTAARMVKRSKARLFQLKAAIALDRRFILIPSESHSQKLLIRLREFY
jgi:uncharacterized coiled-coil protein SlyX